MTVIFPLIALLLMYLFARRLGRDPIDSPLLALIAWATYAVVVTEVLSLFRALTVVGVSVAWVGAGMLLTVALLRSQVASSRRVRRYSGDPDSVGDASGSREYPRARRGSTPVLLLLMGIVLSATFIVALVAPPNNFDSLTYHLPRVMHWIQDATVAHYPTNILRQLYLSPGAEYLLLQLQITSGGDRLDNLVQWSAMVGCLIGVARLAKQLGCGPPGQLMAAAFACALPIGVLESVTTQNDYVQALWLICFVSFGWEMVANVTGGKRIAPIVGASLGLALLTKGTSLILAVPFLLWISVVLLRRYGTRGLRVFAVMMLVALLINLGWAARNMRTFDSPLGLSSEPAVGQAPALVYANDSLRPAALVSNISRNIALDFAAPSRKWNDLLYRSVRELHHMIGVDLDNPRTTWIGKHFQLESDHWNDENVAGNPLHSLLIVICMIAIFTPRWRGCWAPRIGVILWLLAYTGFAWVFRWQPWHTRLHLPLLVLACPLIALVLENAWRNKLAYLLSGVLLLLAIPYAVDARYRALVGQSSILLMDRDDAYFLTQQPYGPVMHAMAAYCQQRHAHNVGLAMGSDTMEYPLWVLIDGARIEHVSVPNVSAKLPYPAGPFTPEVVLTP